MKNVLLYQQQIWARIRYLQQIFTLPFAGRVIPYILSHKLSDGINQVLANLNTAYCCFFRILQ
jgi:hypothetical protein